ncbi:FecR/PupR family sigma factor regulator [Gluconacetobacter sacchari]|uniref:FecR/PupR family sigma factor regulator n=1 Tax=Gluconacetobacter sacchari TaxID=92759 RepID=UPI0039B5EF35
MAGPFARRGDAMPENPERRAHPVDEAAFDWVLRLDRGALAPSDAADLDAWLKADSRHRGAFLRARALWRSADRVAAFRSGAGAVPEAEPAPCRAMGRRRMVASAAAVLAAGVVLGATAGPGEAREPARFFRSGCELPRPVRLAGGTFRLDRTSQLVCLMRGGRIYGDLLGGRVRVDWRQGPMSVRAGGVEIDTVAASFVMRCDRDGQSVLLLEGSARLRDVAGGGTHMLRRAQWARLAPTGRWETGSLSADDLDYVSAWSHGRLELRAASVAEAIGTINLYNDTHIHVADATLARQRIDGIFSLTDPETFARSLCRMFHARLVTSAHGLELR